MSLKGVRRAVSKEDLKKFVEGQRVVNALVREETWRRLATLKVEEAREEHDGLCQLWESNPVRHDLGDLDRIRVDEIALTSGTSVGGWMRSRRSWMIRRSPSASSARGRST